ncbi:hypothetical protein N9O61_02285 [Octadecabacter sp.]|nr:hypothetical protein [Octadecabacter sp.]
MKQFILALTISLIGHSVSSGTPVDEPAVCPVGGETFTVVGTLSCSFRGRNLLFAQDSSCNFITRLPICPSNGLPVYKAFSEGEIEHLESWVETPAFAALKELPPWRRAYEVERNLNQAETSVTFGIMLGAYWYDTTATLEDEEMFSLFISEAAAEYDRAPAENRPFMDAMLGYAWQLKGNQDLANTHLMRAQQASDDAYLQSYVEKIRSCAAQMDAFECLPSSGF